MCTSCMIIVKDTKNQVLLYHHCNSDPHNVGVSLHNLFSGIDNKWSVANISNIILKGGCLNDGCIDGSYELVTEFQENSSYIYEIDCNEQSMTIWEVPMDRYAMPNFKEYCSIYEFH